MIYDILLKTVNDRNLKESSDNWREEQIENALIKAGASERNAQDLKERDPELAQKLSEMVFDGHYSVENLYLGEDGVLNAWLRKTSYGDDIPACIFSDEKGMRPVVFLDEALVEYYKLKDEPTIESVEDENTLKNNLDEMYSRIIESRKRVQEDIDWYMNK